MIISKLQVLGTYLYSACYSCRTLAYQGDTYFAHLPTVTDRFSLEMPAFSIQAVLCFPYYSLVVTLLCVCVSSDMSIPV